MTLNDVNLFRLLPQFMQDDRNSQAFVYALQKQLNKVSASIVHAKIYSRIDSLSEELLDELAWQFNVVEYKSEYDISIKRSLIKDAMIIHHRRGTVAAVEEVVTNIYGNATVEEWFDYGGEPYHFRVKTENPSSTDEMIRDLERIIKETQNVRSHLEAVIVELMQSMNLYVGCRVIIMDEVSLICNTDSIDARIFLTDELGVQLVDENEKELYYY